MEINIINIIALLKKLILEKPSKNEHPFWNLVIDLYNCFCTIEQYIINTNQIFYIETYFHIKCYNENIFLFTNLLKYTKKYINDILIFPNNFNNALIYIIKKIDNLLLFCNNNNINLFCSENVDISYLRNNNVKEMDVADTLINLSNQKPILAIIPKQHPIPANIIN